MDFDDTPEEAAFRAEARAWLEANAEPKKGASVTTWKGRFPDADQALARARDYQARKADAGLAAITWPVAWGGRGGTPLEQVILAQEEEDFIVPRGYFDIGLGMCLPTVLTYADEEHKRRFGPPALRGAEIWSQLFSEPAAGSDVAGLRTRAVRDGDEWVVNGQKIWTSGAHYSDFGILLTRTDPDVPKHKGLTMFIVDLKAPGVTIRPIRQLDGGANFNEVYFEDVRIPDAMRLGAPGEGWKVALTTLMNERLAVGESPAPDFWEAFELARDSVIENGPALADAGIRAQLADWYLQWQGMKLTRARTLTRLSKGGEPGPEASIIKLVSARKMQHIASFGMELQELTGAIIDPQTQPQAGLFQQGVYEGAWRRIAGGTDEILRNIIAERVLGLPGDVRVDKMAAFKDLPTGR